MKPLFLVFPLLVAACSAQQLSSAQSITAQAVQQGALFCATVTKAGPLVIALANAAGVPVSVTNQSAADVAAACKLIDAIPVSPPANSTAVPVVAAPTTLPAIATAAS